MNKFSRAAFVTGSLAATVAPTMVRASTSYYYRHNIYNIMGRCSLQAVLTGYENAVSAMLALSANDPRSWVYQANIHGTTASVLQPDWNSCQHSSYFFFSWHRMYLYWFERIARSFSGVSGFALPYWNYSNGLNPGNTENILPSPFRNSATSLYTANRNAGVNAGNGLPASAIAIAASMSDSGFSSRGKSSYGFGGGPPRPDVPTQFSSYAGDIEQQPHNVVHDAVGGLMGDITTAAQDPIFFLHHANIDRLWTLWLSSGGGRQDPSDSTWLNTQFTFYDENAQPRVMTGAQITSTRHLGYKYGEDEPPNPPCSASLARFPKQSLDSVISRQASPQMHMSGAVAAHGVQLVAPRVVVSVASALKPETHMALANTAQSVNNRVFLSFGGISYDRSPGYYYEIYLNLPDGVPANYLNAYYVGNLSFFGAWMHVNGKMTNTPETFDITALVQREIQLGHWSEKNSKVTLIMQGANDTTRLRFAVQANTRVDSVVITETR